MVCALSCTSAPVCVVTTSLRDAESLARRFARVTNQRVVKSPRTKRAIQLVAAVGEGFGRDAKTCLVKNVEHRRAGEADKDDVLVGAFRKILFTGMAPRFVIPIAPAGPGESKLLLF